MKARVEEGSLRLRLKQKEVEEFFESGKINSTTRLGPDPDSYIRFTLLKDGVAKEVQVNFKNNEISVSVPLELANSWAQTDQEGFQSFIPVEENQQLHIIVEKDFRCLHKDPDNKEDEDNFPNPLENGTRC